jgi:O-antigen/teichoic acid export membrane protein
LLLLITFFVTNIWLARILSPEIIGVFNIGTSILAFFTYFSDVGLAGAIIQKKDLNDDDIKTTFTIQQGLVATITAVIFLLAPWFAQYYGLDDSGTWLIRALAIGFLFSSFKVLPSVLLERRLEFKPQVLVEIVETIVHLTLLIYLSYQNWGVTAYTVAVLARGVVGTVLIYIIAPIKIGFGISKASFKQLINFGVPFQVNSILALLKDRLVPLVVAGMVGPFGMSQITWAMSIAFMSLEVMNNMSRVMFPAFARMQHDPEGLKQTLERTIFLTCLLFYPALFGTLAVAPSLVEHVVSSKWLPALPLIYLFAINVFWAALSTSFTNFLNAVGKIGITLKLMVMWTVLEWLLVPLLTINYNIYGVPLGQAIISFTSLIPIIIVTRMVKINIFKQVWRPLTASLIMSGITFFATRYWVLLSQPLTQMLKNDFISNVIVLLLMVFFGVIVYLGLVFVIARSQILASYKLLRNV